MSSILKGITYFKMLRTKCKNHNFSGLLITGKQLPTIQGFSRNLRTHVNPIHECEDRTEIMKRVCELSYSLSERKRNNIILKQVYFCVITT